jgi:hypothetical protein
MSRPLCKDCKWFRPSNLGISFHQCGRLPKNKNLVTGEPAIRFCDLERWWMPLWTPDCGPRGKFFEPRAE